MNGLDRAIGHFGSQRALANALGLKCWQNVQQWKLAGRVPAKYCPVIERMTDGLVQCEELNTEVDWSIVRANGKQYHCTGVQDKPTEGVGQTAEPPPVLDERDPNRRGTAADRAPRAEAA